MENAKITRNFVDKARPKSEVDYARSGLRQLSREGKSTQCEPAVCILALQPARLAGALGGLLQFTFISYPPIDPVIFSYLVSKSDGQALDSGGF